MNLLTNVERGTLNVMIDTLKAIEDKDLTKWYGYPQAFPILGAFASVPLGLYASGAAIGKTTQAFFKTLQNVNSESQQKEIAVNMKDARDYRLIAGNNILNILTLGLLNSFLIQGGTLFGMWLEKRVKQSALKLQGNNIEQISS